MGLCRSRELTAAATATAASGPAVAVIRLPLCFEGVPTATAGYGIGVFDLEAATHDAFFVVNGSLVKVHHAGGVYENFDALVVDDVVVGAGLGFQSHAVLQTGATATADKDAQAIFGHVLLD